MPQDFKQLNVWQEAKEFTLDIYRVTAEFPKAEQYGITNQLRRAASSVGSNIAEGCGRTTDKDFANFLIIAMGSIKECEHFLILSRDLNYLSTNDHQLLTNKLETIGKMLNKFMQKVRG